MTAPFEDQHLDQARRNLAHAEFLLRDHANDPTCVQWAVTAAFYCAVHCLQSHLLRAGVDPKTHVRRAELIAIPAYAVPADVQEAYEFLKQRSEKARYRLAAFDPSYVQRRIIGHYLTRVTAFVDL